MPKIPVIRATGQLTAEPTGVTTNLQISPTATPAAALLKPISKIEQYYAQEKQISNKVKAGELLGKATVEVFNAAKTAETKSTPEDGVNFFRNEYKRIKNIYKSQATNSDIAKYFDLQFANDESKYVNNILTKTRDKLVKTRVTQNDERVKTKIANALAGNNFQFEILTDDIVNDYQSLVDDGIIGESDLALYKKQLPKLIEIEQVRNLAKTDAAGAAVLLQDINNFKTIQGDDRKKLTTEVRQKAKFDSEVLKFNNASAINKSLKVITDRLKGSEANKVYGLSEEELMQYSTGDSDADNQIKNLNIKINQGEFSFDTNYNTNTSIIDKINLGDIKNLKDQFILPGEKTAKSIVERAGDGSINDSDLNFLTTISARSFNNTFAEQDKKYLQWFDNLTPLLQGNVFLSYFDKEYNSKASNLRQVYYKKYIQGLATGIDINDLLSPNSENYIAKDIKNVLPKTSDLSSIVKSITDESQLKTVPERLPNETASDYELRTLGVK